MKKVVQYAIENRAVTYFITFILFFGGIASFFSLGQLEDPVFTVKSAVIYTEYPGASPLEVELEVTDRLEKAIQELTQLKFIYSTSKAGESAIKVDIEDRYWSDELPQVWDELRRKVRDVEKDLPPGVKTPIVNDDFGFVYGFVLALTGQGYSDRELESFADTVKKELSLVKGVTRVDLWGVQPQVIYVDISEQKINEMGISGNTIIDTLSQQNMVVDAGGAEVENLRFRVAPTGEFKTPEEIGELKIRPSTSDLINLYVEDPKKVQTTSEDFILLKDIATVRRGYLEPPITKMRYDGQPAIGIQIAGSERENIVAVGERLIERVTQLETVLPVGIELNKVAWQSDLVDDSVNSFIINLLEAVVIVLIVLIIPSGFRMGFIIGFDLILTILGTFIFMAINEIPLQRMSLGALIIALGMMVDNAIVISDNIAVKMRQGMNRTEAAVTAVTSSAYALFAATVIAVMAFYPIVASKASSGEYAMSLFTVVATALFLSWFIAIFLTPVQCLDFLAVTEKKEGDDEFKRPLFQIYKKVLRKLIRVRFLTIGVMAGVLIFSIFSFGWVNQMFFPDSSRPQLMIDFWMPEGTRIQNVEKDVLGVEEAVYKSPSVESISTFIGAGPPRFYLPIDPESVNANFAQLIINFRDFREINAFIEEYKPFLNEKFPEALIRFRKFGVGPSDSWKFEARVSGPANANLTTLRELGDQIMAISEKSPYGEGWRTDMMNPVLKVVPEYDQKRARLASITREELARTLKRGYDGVNVGIYREHDKLLPIVIRNIEQERQEYPNRMEILQVQPQGTNKGIPTSQAIKDLNLEWEDPIIVRWNRRRAVTVQGNPILGQTFPTLQASVIDQINQVELPPEYELFWDGEARSTREAQEALIPGLIPAAIVILFLIVTVFNAFKPLIIILLTIPLSIIGITWGLIILDTPFGFMALLGAMSLAGMMNKNIVVLLDACNENLAQGMSRYQAINAASVTRVRPVLLAAGTTVLGVIPLVSDVFWTAMAVTIMAGLSFGSLLTLIVVPVLYAIFYKLKEEPS